MSYLLKAENRPISLAEVKRRKYPSPIPAKPGKDAFVVDEIYWYDNAKKPVVTIFQAAKLENTFVEVAENRYERQWTVVDKYDSVGDARKTKLQEINDWYNMEMDRISTGLTQHEINTFYRQDLEAAGLHSDASTTTPFITKQAAERNITVSALKDKILTKATVFNDLSAKALGRKQFLEDLVDTANTIEDVINIEVGYAN